MKANVLACLGSGAILHAERGNIDVKNLLATGEVTTDEIAEVIGRARGTDYQCSPHHLAANIDVHIIKTAHRGMDWYIKWYFVEPNCVFISVHH